jgi:VanZ family protein
MSRWPRGAGEKELIIFPGSPADRGQRRPPEPHAPAAFDRDEGTEPVDSTTPIWRKPHVMGYWLPPILWGLAVVSLSGNVGSATNTRNLLQWLLSGFVTLEPAQINLINFSFRKTGHVLAYGFLYFLWFRAFRTHQGYGPGRSCLWSLGFCLLFSSLDEGRQWLFPTRSASLRDVLLDMSGASLAALITCAIWTPRDHSGPRMTR